MKKAVKILLCVLLLITVTCAQAVERAGKLVEMDSLQHYPSYQCDEATGKWTVHAYQADALMDRFWDFVRRNSARTVVFHLAAEGDARTGVWMPVLHFYHADGTAINARAVSILVDGQRYDLAASSSSVSHNRAAAEKITVPLGEQGLQVAYAMQKAAAVTVRLIGEEMYTVQFSSSATATRQALEGASLLQMDSGMALLEELGVNGYSLWDLSDAAWEREYGYLPALTKGSVSDHLRGAPIADSMGMIVPETSGAAAEAAQEELIAYGFLSGSVSYRIGDPAVEAVLRAQKYLGRVPTGCVDEALLEALASGRPAKAENKSELLALGEAVEIGLNRCWFARGVSASANAESLRTVVNADNAFLIADGSIRNLSTEELHLFMQMDTQLVYNGRYAYEAELACECSDGTELDTRLLPMAQARLLVYAEIPSALAADEQAQWSIAFEMDGQSLVIDLE